MDHSRLMDWNIISDMSKWPGETLCLKQYGKKDYEAFGVIVHNSQPITVYLRGKTEDEDFKTCKVYQSFAELFADGWIVD